MKLWMISVVAVLEMLLKQSKILENNKGLCGYENGYKE